MCQKSIYFTFKKDFICLHLMVHLLAKDRKRASRYGILSVNRKLFRGFKKNQLINYSP